MFLKLVIVLAVAALSGCTSCGLKNVLVDLSGNIAIKSSDGQQVVIETVQLSPIIAGTGEIKIHVRGPSGITNTLQYPDEQVTRNGQTESDILSEVFDQFSGQQDEITFQTLKNAVLRLTEARKINPIILEAIEQLSCENQVISNSVFGIRQQQQWPRSLENKLMGNRWAMSSLGSQVGQRNVLQNQIAQSELQQALEQEAQLAKISQIAAQQEVQSQAQLTKAILNKEAEVQAIAENEALRKVQRANKLRSLGRNVGVNRQALASLVNQAEQEIAATQIAQAQIQQALQQEAQLAKTSQIKAQQEAQTQAQLAQAILEKEEEINSVALKQSLNGGQRFGGAWGLRQQHRIQNVLSMNNNVDTARSIGTTGPFSSFGKTQAHTELRNILLGVPQQSILENVRRPSFQQQLSGLTNLNDNVQVQRLAQQLRAQGVQYPQNVRMAEKLVAQNSQGEMQNFRQIPVSQAWSQLVGRTQSVRPYFV